jgi:hypothetical protein
MRLNTPTCVRDPPVRERGGFSKATQGPHASTSPPSLGSACRHLGCGECFRRDWGIGRLRHGLGEGSLDEDARQAPIDHDVSPAPAISRRFPQISIPATRVMPVRLPPGRAKLFSKSRPAEPRTAVCRISQCRMGGVQLVSVRRTKGGAGLSGALLEVIGSVKPRCKLCLKALFNFCIVQLPQRITHRYRRHATGPFPAEISKDRYLTGCYRPSCPRTHLRMVDSGMRNFGGLRNLSGSARRS